MSQEFNIGDIIAGQDSDNNWYVGTNDGILSRSTRVVVGKPVSREERYAITTSAGERRAIQNPILLSPKQPRSLNSEHTPSGEHGQSGEYAALEKRVKAIETWILEKAAPSFRVFDHRLKRLQATARFAPPNPITPLDDLLQDLFGKKD